MADSMDIDLSAELSAFHVGDARHTATNVPVVPSESVQESLLSDEDIVEGILFCVTGRAVRPSVIEVTQMNDSIMGTLRSARCVSRLWHTAGSKPLLAAALDKQLVKAKLFADFLAKRRNASAVETVQPRVHGLAPAEIDAVRWMIGGWENGFNSVLADDDGLDTIGPCVGVISHLVAMRVRGAYVIVAAESAWPAWEEAVHAQLNVHAKATIEVAQARTGDQLDELVAARFDGVVLLPMQPAATQIDDLRDALGEASSALNVKFVIFDERQERAGVSRLTVADLDGNQGHHCNHVRLTHRPLPSSLRDLTVTLAEVTNGALPVTSADIERTLHTYCTGARAAHLRDWAIRSFLVPTLQAALSRVLFMRRLKRHGQPTVVSVEPPGIVVVDVSDSTDHWLVGSVVRLTGLSARPELNGRIGSVHGFDPATDRLQVLLQRQPDLPELSHKWLKVKETNVVPVSPLHGVAKRSPSSSLRGSS